MKHSLTTALMLSFLASTPAIATEYTIDPFHTNIRFAIDHFNTSSNVGGFYGVTGSLTADAKKRTGSIDITVPVNSLQASSKEFTGHLLSKDLFNAEQFPEMRFVSTKFNYSGKKLKSVDGQLTLLGKTAPIRLIATKFNCYQSPMLKTQVCGGDFTANIDRTKWGMNYLVDMGVTKNVKIDIQIEAGKK